MVRGPQFEKRCSIPSIQNLFTKIQSVPRSKHTPSRLYQHCRQFTTHGSTQPFHSIQTSRVPHCARESTKCDPQPLRKVLRPSLAPIFTKLAAVSTALRAHIVYDEIRPNRTRSAGSTERNLIAPFNKYVVHHSNFHEFSQSLGKLLLTSTVNRIYIQSVPGGMDKTSGECSLC